MRKIYGNFRKRTLIKSTEQLTFFDWESPLNDLDVNDQVSAFKGATKSYRKIIFVPAAKIGVNTTNILNCYFSS